MAAMPVRKLRLWQDKIETEVAILGDGPPLVFLHGAWGLRHDQEFLELLAQTHTVYAPKFPGTSSHDPDAVHQIDDWLDLIIYHGELLDRLALKHTVLVGHSFGGMLACEIAAAMPERVGKLVLIDPAGLYRDDIPVKNWMVLSPDELRAALFADPKSAHAQKFFSAPEDDAARIDAKVDFVWSQACTGKFIWPIPDQGPTLIVWGKADGIVAPVYVDEFARRIAHARVTLLDGAGHLPHFEQAQGVATLVGEFLRD
jgi:pimeloyl-ACP methyl ester carboxylesterase